MTNSRSPMTELHGLKEWTLWQHPTATITGTSGDDNPLFGTAQNDWIDGQSGNDSIFPDFGNDFVMGGAGNDFIQDTGAEQGGKNQDVILGGDGDDTVFAGGGRDLVIGGKGNDFLRDDPLGHGGHDYFMGGRGNDSLVGDDGNDRLQGDKGNDFLFGGRGDDLLTGGSGHDTFMFRNELTGGVRALGVDKITDFRPSQDVIELSRETFTQLRNGFSFVSVASDQAARVSEAWIVYSRSTGRLFYNENSTACGFGQGGQFATLVGHPPLTTANFWVT